MQVKQWKTTSFFQFLVTPEGVGELVGVQLQFKNSFNLILMRYQCNKKLTSVICKYTIIICRSFH